MFIYSLNVTGCCSSVLRGMSGFGLLMLFLHAVDIELFYLGIKTKLVGVELGDCA